MRRRRRRSLKPRKTDVWDGFSWELPGTDLSRDDRLLALTKLLKQERKRLARIREQEVSKHRRRS